MIIVIQKILQYSESCKNCNVVLAYYYYRYLQYVHVYFANEGLTKYQNYHK